MERKISFLLDYLSLWLSIYNKMLPYVQNETSGMAVQFEVEGCSLRLRGGGGGGGEGGGGGG